MFSNQKKLEHHQKNFQLTLSQAVGAQRAQSQQQASNPPSPNSSVSKPLPVALLKRFKSKSTREISEKKRSNEKTKENPRGKCFQTRNLKITAEKHTPHMFMDVHYCVWSFPLQMCK